VGTNFAFFLKTKYVVKLDIFFLAKKSDFVASLIPADIFEQLNDTLP